MVGGGPEVRRCRLLAVLGTEGWQVVASTDLAQVLHTTPLHTTPPLLVMLFLAMVDGKGVTLEVS